MAVGALVGGTVGSALIGGMASSKASKAQTQAADAAVAAQLEMFYTSREDMAPWVSAGKWALNQLVGTSGTGAKEGSAGGYWSEPVYEKRLVSPKSASDFQDPQDYQAYTMLGPQYENVLVKPPEWIPGTEGAAGTGAGTTGLLQKGPGEFIPEEEPGYKFGYQEFVENPTLRAASATGMLGSGRTQKALTRYASDYASTKYDNFLDRYYKSLDPYFRMAGLGSNVAISSGSQATQTGQGMANALMDAGAGRASGYINMANTLTGGISSGVNNYLLYNILSKNPNWPSL